MTDEASSDELSYDPRPPSGEFGIYKIYAKDMSFETPHSPDIFSVEWTPEADVNFRSDVTQPSPGQYEVTMTITVTVTVEGRTAFLAEVQQAGLFMITGMTSDELENVLGAYCPSILYPYARELVSDLVTRGGFPPFILSPVNFDVLFAQNRTDREPAVPGPTA